MFNKGQSEFDGGLLGLIGVNIVVFFVTLITLGIAFPWMTCYKERWFAKHTVIDGKRFKFDGTGGQLIGSWIKWILLTIITLGIYGLWVVVKIENWKTKHTIFEDSASNDDKSRFKGGVLGMLGINIATVFLTLITIGIATPWIVTMRQRWFSKHTIIEGYGMGFNGSGIGLFGNFIKWFLLTIITVGIYGLWVNIKMHKWVVKNTEFVEA